LAEPVRDLVEAEHLVFQGRGTLKTADNKPTTRTSNASSPTDEGGAAWSKLTGADLLAVALGGHGSSKTARVEPRGLEPLTPTLPVWCATSCATAPDTRPTGTAQYYTRPGRRALSACVPQNPIGRPRIPKLVKGRVRRVEGHRGVHTTLPP
jgi:hypothetical protein